MNGCVGGWINAMHRVYLICSATYIEMLHCLLFIVTLQYCSVTYAPVPNGKLWHFHCVHFNVLIMIRKHQRTFIDSITETAINMHNAIGV